MLVLFFTVISLATVLTQATTSPPASPRRPDVFYVPTPPAVVDAMLELAHVGPSDVVYDLGSGDGRIPIAAAQKFGARGVGIDIDPKMIADATENAKLAGVAGKVTFLNQDLFEANISEATVVTLYLLPSLNEKLMPKLKKELKPGTRVVSHAFSMGEQWSPDEKREVGGRTIYLWRIR
jgi:cyclopropane fatty-acyl-phospholipid synthase-like methyltransferase